MSSIATESGEAETVGGQSAPNASTVLGDTLRAALSGTWVLAVFGVVGYVAGRIGAAVYYENFGVTPEEVGIQQADFVGFAFLFSLSLAVGLLGGGIVYYSTAPWFSQRRAAWTWTLLGALPVAVLALTVILGSQGSNGVVFASLFMGCISWILPDGGACAAQQIASTALSDFGLIFWVIAHDAIRRAGAHTRTATEAVDNGKTLRAILHVIRGRLAIRPAKTRIYNIPSSHDCPRR